MAVRPLDTTRFDDRSSLSSYYCLSLKNGSTARQFLEEGYLFLARCKCNRVVYANTVINRCSEGIFVLAYAA